jgi:hypothetical protein
VSTTQAELVAKFAAGVVVTGGKFAASVVDTGGNLPPVSLTRVPRICHRGQICHWCRCRCREFSKKIKMTLMLFSGAWGKVIHEKNLKQKIS